MRQSRGAVWLAWQTASEWMRFCAAASDAASVRPKTPEIRRDAGKVWKSSVSQNWWQSRDRFPCTVHTRQLNRWDRNPAPHDNESDAPTSTLQSYTLSMDLSHIYCLSASELTYIVSGGALNSTLTHLYCLYLAWRWRCQRKPSALALLHSGFWNSQSFDCRSAQLASLFRRSMLKTELFDIAYSENSD